MYILRVIDICGGVDNYYIFSKRSLGVYIMIIYFFINIYGF